ncbi:MAG: aminopeptidase P family protein [Thermoleophilia bacterium]|nr:aminopeptidase P family protein [Thermoleophilia bacterium]
MCAEIDSGLDSVASRPFDNEKLDALLSASAVDAVVATSRHNVRYLLGYYSIFFERFDAIGVDRFVPALGYVSGRPENAFAIGHELDAWQHEAEPPWVPTVVDTVQTSAESAAAVADCLCRLGLDSGAIALEHSFVPVTFRDELARRLPHATFVEAHPFLEELRAVKTPRELAILRTAAEEIVASIVATMQSGEPGVTTRALVDRLRREEEMRGLDFEYCLVATGASFNRAPSQARWERGASLSLDSGGQSHGYLGDLARMAVLGEPTAQLRELLDEVHAIQAAARAPIRRGALGGEIYESALAERAGLPHGDQTVFLAHGMGLISHEAPRLTDTGAVRYPAAYRDRPLEAGMVLSIETDLKAPGVGYVKIEDTVVVTETGWEAYGDDARGWNIVEG